MNKSRIKRKRWKAMTIRGKNKRRKNKMFFWRQKSSEFKFDANKIKPMSDKEKLERIKAEQDNEAELSGEFKKLSGKRG